MVVVWAFELVEGVLVDWAVLVAEVVIVAVVGWVNFVVVGDGLVIDIIATGFVEVGIDCCVAAVVILVVDLVVAVAVVVGHAWLLHDTVSSSLPVQSLPPYNGVGLLHFLVCLRYPLPQLTEQIDSDSHALHPPFTE